MARRTRWLKVSVSGSDGGVGVAGGVGIGVGSVGIVAGAAPAMGQGASTAVPRMCLQGMRAALPPDWNQSGQSQSQSVTWPPCSRMTAW